jgi:hypothetical protein
MVKCMILNFIYFVSLYLKFIYMLKKEEKKTFCTEDHSLRNIFLCWKHWKKNILKTRERTLQKLVTIQMK